MTAERKFKAAAAALTAVVIAACASDGGKGAPGEASAPATSTSAERGYAFAEAHCAACHGVAPGVTSSPLQSAPTFESLANNPAVTRLGLNALLETSHRNMPNIIVAPDSRDDLWAYFSVLRGDEGI